MTLPPIESYREIPLTSGQIAIVDAADYEWLMQWRWGGFWHPRTKSFYARRNSAPRVMMHSFILGIKPPFQVDHENHDTLDNRRSNLRQSTASQNCQNRRRRVDSTSGYKGVSFWKKNGKWGASIFVNGKLRFLGLFVEKIEAARVYDREAIANFGDFALTNFPKTDYEHDYKPIFARPTGELK